MYNTASVGPPPKARDKKTPRTKPEDSRLKKLEDLHNQAGVMKLQERRLIKLSISGSNKPKLGKDMDFDIKFADLTDKKEESPETMPDSQEVLASVFNETPQKNKEKSKKPSSPPSADYYDPELDAIMLTIDTESIDASSGTKSGTSIEKRKLNRINHLSSDERSIDITHDQTAKQAQDTSLVQRNIKRRKLDVDDDDTSNDLPLFLPDPPLLTQPTDPMTTARHDNVLATESGGSDDYLTLSSALFDIVPSHQDDYDNSKEDDIAPCLDTNDVSNNVLEWKGDKPATPGPQSHLVEDTGEMNETFGGLDDFDEWLKTNAVIVTGS